MRAAEPLAAAALAEPRSTAAATVAAAALARLRHGLLDQSFASDPKAVAACPTAAVLRPLSQTAVFRPGAAPQPTNVAFYGILTDVEAKCDRAAGAVRASLDVVIIGERGPAAARRQ